jgi:hypothetical protein
MHAVAAGIGLAEVAVNVPEARDVEVLGQRDAVQTDPARHAENPRHRPAVEGEMLRHLRMAVCVDPLHGASPLSYPRHSQPSTSAKTA